MRVDPKQINDRFYQAFAAVNSCCILHNLHKGSAGSNVMMLEMNMTWATIAPSKSIFSTIDVCCFI
jgi:hypothetical protein